MHLTLRRLIGVAAAVTAVASAASIAPAADPQTGLKAEYFDAMDLTGSPVVTRVDPEVNFNWGLNEPVAGVGETFSVRWTGTITPRYTEAYTLYTTSDDGVRLYVDGQLLIDDWRVHSANTNHAVVNLIAGRKHEIEIEYYDGLKHALARLEWRSASQRRQVVPSEQLAPPAGTPPLPVEVDEDEQDGIGEVPGGIVDVGEVAEETGTATTAAALPPAAAATTTAATETATETAGETAAAATAATTALPPPAPPIPGETFNAEPANGEVLVRRPADGALIPLETGASLPVGTRLDTRDGSVVVETAPAAGVAANQFAAFGGATFRVSQPRDGGKVVTLDMMHGDFESCVSEPARRFRKGRARAAGKRRTTSARRSVRELWGSGKGRFRTRGRHAAATVRGTEWSIEDRCDATVVRVRSGVVDVEDFLSGRTVAVRAGESHVTAPR